MKNKHIIKNSVMELLFYAEDLKLDLNTCICIFEVVGIALVPSETGSIIVINEEEFIRRLIESHSFSIPIDGCYKEFLLDVTNISDWGEIQC